MSQFHRVLENLREQVLTGDDFHAMMTYFFDHCSDHDDFMALGSRAEDPVLEAVVSEALAFACHGPVKLSFVLLTRLPDEKFIHGGFFVDGLPGSLIYFEELDRGVAALLRRSGGVTDFVRFTCKRLGVANPWQ